MNMNRLLRRPFLGFHWITFLAVVAAKANTVTVMNNNDSGSGSLRAAIAATAANGTIVFDPSVTGTITLTSGELAIGGNLTIIGPGAKVLAVSGNNASRVFDISSGVTVNISGLSLVEGLSPVF